MNLIATRGRLLGGASLVVGLTVIAATPGAGSLQHRREQSGLHRHDDHNRYDFWRKST